jgi:exosortase A-associated hydrolase 2
VNRGSVSGHFLGAPGRRIFALLREPAGRPRGGTVLVVPPFGEEMNKSRRMITETAQRLCDAGRPVLMPDLYGTGDSEGEFHDARVDLWLEDLELACRFAAGRGSPVEAILAVRLGCALAVAAARRGALPVEAASAWWQPALDGRRYLAQFLRLRVAAGSMRGEAPETVDGLRVRSAGGEVLTVAGYDLSPALVKGLESLSAEALPPRSGRLHWFEFVRDAGAVPPLPATRFVERAQVAGASVVIETVAAEPFWLSSEIVRLPEIADRTASVLAGAPGGASGQSAPAGMVRP